MSYFHKNKTKTYYIKKGKKSSKTPIISCHGGPGGTHLSTIKMLDLALDRQVVCYDQIGSGKSSSLNKDQYNIETFVENLNDLRIHLGYNKVILHGSSWGGTLILEYAHKYPQFVEAIIFHSALFNSKKWSDDAQRLIKKMPKSTQKVIKYCEEIGATDSKVYKDAMKKYYLKHVCRDKEAYQKKVKVNFNEELYNYMWGPSEFCATGTLKNYNGASKLKKLNVPTLFVCGKYDESTPETNLFYSRTVKNAEFFAIPNASHSSLRENPLKTLKIIQSFLDKNTL